ncbi:MAG: hypothetical protein AB7S98_21785 [Burkholderiaceae bacterium]
MNDPKKRIRWTLEERRTLAQRLAEVLRDEPHLSKLQAMERAQTALPSERRRHLAAWSTVREFIEPYMPVLAPQGADAQGAEPDSSATDDATAQLSLDTPPDELASADIAGGEAGNAASAEALTAATAESPDGEPGEPAGAGEAAGTAGAGSSSAAVSDPIEAALLCALSSPRVVDKLAAVFASALGRALEQVPAAAPVSATPAKGNGSPAPAPVASPRPKVLIAGISPADAHHLGEVMRNKLDLRFWRQGDSREQLRLHGRSCSVAVVMSEAVDSDVEALLRSMQLRVVRHTYNASRLEERLNEMQDHGMFNLLI